MTTLFSVRTIQECCNKMTDRYFTLEEAQKLIPWVHETFQAIQKASAKALKVQTDLKGLVGRMQSNGGSEHDQELKSLQSLLVETTSEAQKQIEVITRRGIIVRDLQRGLIDFPSLREGREVYLCWLYGESAIEHWHEIDVGFSGRQPL